MVRAERPTDDTFRHRSSLPRIERSNEEVVRIAEIIATYFCPICGIELAQSDFDKPEVDYYCPFCSTRRTPQPDPQGARW